MKTVFLWILYILFGYVAALVHKLYRISSEMNIWRKLLFVCSNMEVMVRHPFQKFLMEDVLAGIVAALFLLYRKFLKTPEMVYNNIEIKIGMTKERRS